MMRRLWCLLGAIVGVFVAVPGNHGSLAAHVKEATRQESTGPHAARKADPTRPGPEQASLAKLAGEYTRVVKFVGPQGAGTPPSSGTAKITVVLGGRFLLEESTDMVFGREVDGLRLYGYNNVAKQYEMVRLYTMSTAMTMMTGTSDDNGKTILFSGSSQTSGPGRMPLRSRLRRVNDDEFVVTMSTTGPDGKEMDFQETEYTRKK